MPTVQSCSRCSAPITDIAALQCPFCQAVIERPVTAGVESMVSPVRFARVESSPS